MRRIGRAVMLILLLTAGGCAGPVPGWGRVWTDPYGHRGAPWRGQMRGTTPGMSLAL